MSNRNLVCGEGFEADGQVYLDGAYVGGKLDLTDGRFRNPSGTAISPLDAELGDLVCGEGFEADGQVRLRRDLITRGVSLPRFADLVLNDQWHVAAEYFPAASAGR